MKKKIWNSQHVPMSGILAAGSRFEGDIVFDGILRIDGCVRGKITSQTEKPSILIISEHAMIEADIIVDIVIISGQVLGNVFAQDRIELSSPGRLEGKIYTFDLVIDDNALFQGECTMLRHLARNDRRLLKYAGFSKLEEKFKELLQTSIISD